MPVAHGLDILSYVLTLSLVVLGLGIIFGLLGVINMAHGQFLALGAYGVIVGDKAGLGFWGGALIGILIAASVGAATQLFLIRPLQSDLISTLLATYGLGLVIQQTLQWIFGASGRAASNPVIGNVRIFGTAYPSVRIVVMITSAIVLAGFAWFFGKSRWGIKARAAVEDRSMAQALGIRVKMLDVAMFSLGTGITGLAGAMLAPTMAVQPNMGSQFLILSFLVVILTGLDRVRRNLLVLVVGAMVVGASSSVLTLQIGAVFAELVVLGLVVVILVARPQGIVRGG